MRQYFNTFLKLPHAVPVGEPILRDRSAVPDSLGPLRQVAHRMGTRPGNLRFRPSRYRHRLRARPPHEDGLGGFPGEDRASATITRTSPSPSVAV